MEDKADYAKDQIISILSKYKKQNAISRVDLQDLISNLEEDALNNNLDNTVTTESKVDIT